MTPRTKPLAIAAAVLALAAGAAHADSKNKPEHANGKKPEMYETNRSQVVPYNCPPGLAKKNPPCIPPGLAKKGDRINDDYILIRHPDRYGLDRSGTYYRLGNSVFRIDPETREVLDLIGAIAAVADN